MSNITLNNMHAVGDVYDTTVAQRATKNDVIIANCEDNIVIENCSFAGKMYNTIFTNYNADGTIPQPKNVTITNCDFSGVVANNAISVFGLQQGGTITVKNCHFANVSNAFRFMNATNVSGVTINVEDCTCDKWETTQPNYAGFFIFEDATSASAEEAATADRFASSKITVNVKNLVGPGSVKVCPKESEYSTVIGSKDLNQIAYISIDKDNYSVPDYDAAKYPTFKFE